MKDGYWYLATVYTQHPRGQQAAFEEACLIAADLMRHGFVIYSPIAHSHPIAHAGGLDKLDWEMWKEQCKPMVDAAKGIIVARMEHWEDSVGIRYELDRFVKAGKPVLYLTV